MQEGFALKPLGVGDIVDRVFAIYRSRPLVFLVISAIPYLALVLLLIALTPTLGAGALLALASMLAGDIEGSAAQISASIAPLAAYLGVAIVAALVASLVQSAALVVAAADRYLGRDATVASALRTGLRASPRLLAMGLLAFFAVVLLWGAIVVAMVLVGHWSVVVGGILGGLVATFYITASWMVSPAVAVLEGTGPISSLRRAWRLSEGNRWRILGLIILLVVLQLVLSSVLSVLLIASLVTDETVQVVVQQAANLLMAIAWAPAYWAAFAVLYYDLRVRHEALDLQLAAEALPREA